MRQFTFSEDGLLLCNLPKCGSCRVKEHSIHDLMPGDMLSEDGVLLCIGCGHVNEAGGNPEVPGRRANILKKLKENLQRKILAE